MDFEYNYDRISYQPPSRVRREQLEQVDQAFQALVREVLEVMPETPDTAIAIRAIEDARLKVVRAVNMKDCPMWIEKR